MSARLGRLRRRGTRRGPLAPVRLFFLGAVLVVFFAVLVPAPAVFADDPPRRAQPEVVADGAGDPAETAGPARSVFSGDLATSGAVNPAEERLAAAVRRGLLLAVAWSFLAVALLVVLASLLRTVRWLRELGSSRRAGASKVFRLRLNVRTSSGQVRHFSFESYPVTVSSAGTADLLLPDPRGVRQRFRVDYRDGHGWFESDSPMVINGVPQRQRRLREGDRILFGTYRIDFESAAFVPRPTVVPVRPRYGWQIPAVIALLTLSVLFRQATGVPQARADARLARNAERAAERAAQRDARQRAREAERAVAAAERAEQKRVAAAEQARARAERQAAEAAARAEQERAAAAEARARAEREAAEAAARAEQERAAAAEAREREAAEAAARAEVERQRAEAQRKADEAARLAAAAEAREREAAEAAARAEVERQRAEAQRKADEAVRKAQAEAAALARRAEEARKAAEAARLAVEAEAREREARRSTARSAEASVRGSEAETTVRAGGSPATLVASLAGDLPSAAVERQESTATLARVAPRVFAPGRPISFFPADVLFIHAHPDDESLDFGVLMGRAFRSGKRTVTILFTDGESGLDRYPKRTVGGIYPNHPLQGAALARVRVQEATDAMAILGSEAYVRLGLENRPYNTLRDVVPLETVLEGWGGEQALVDRLVELIRGFAPRVVVSPDSSSGAHEHFEHEAVGYLVKKALDVLEREGESTVRAHLVSVDPFQRANYPECVTVAGSERDPRSGLTYRSIQALALQQHVSQADASVIGLKRLPPLSSEYYQVLRGELGAPLEAWLSAEPKAAELP